MSWQTKAAWAVMSAWMLTALVSLFTRALGRHKRPLRPPWKLAARCAWIAGVLAWAVAVAFWLPWAHSHPDAP